MAYGSPEGNAVVFISLDCAVKRVSVPLIPNTLLQDEGRIRDDALVW
jgi:hypothetical protein